MHRGPQTHPPKLPEPENCRNIEKQRKTKENQWFLIETMDIDWFFFAFPCSGNTPAPGASGDRFGGPGAYFSPIAGRRSGRYLRSKRGIRLQAQLRLAHVPTRSLAFLARFAPVPTRIFVGPYSPLAGAILEGPRGHNPYCWRTDLDDTETWANRRRRGLPIRPYLHARITRITSVEQLPQIIIL